MPLLARLKSVRAVLTVWYSLVLLAAFALFGYSVYVYMESLQRSTLEQYLVDEVDWIARLVEVDRTRLQDEHALKTLSEDVTERIAGHFAMNPRNYVVMLASLDGAILYESDNRNEQMLLGTDVPAGETVRRTVGEPGAGSLRVVARRMDPLIIEVGYTETATDVVLEHLLSIFGFLVPVVLFVAISGGWLMSGIVLRPVRQISEMAKRISVRNLDQRIPARPVPDELGELITTINGMIERLQKSFQQIKEFSMSVAHELKTPLTILKGESELALSKPPDAEETQQLVGTYLEETIRMSRIVDDLLTLAKVDEGQIVLETRDVAMQGMISELYEDALILSTNKKLVVELVRNDEVVISGDHHRLRQLFRILVTNAIQYTDPGGTVRISSYKDSSSLNISVEDTGIGIPAESMGKIFDRFYRVDEARTRASGGSGLGLSIAKWIVDAHHGTIEVRSNMGQGSCFTVHLPLSRH